MNSKLKNVEFLNSDKSYNDEGEVIKVGLVSLEKRERFGYELKANQWCDLLTGEWNLVFEDLGFIVWSDITQHPFTRIVKNDPKKVCLELEFFDNVVYIQFSPSSYSEKHLNEENEIMERTGPSIDIACKVPDTDSSEVNIYCLSHDDISWLSEVVLAAFDLPCDEILSGFDWNGSNERKIELS